MANTHQSRRFYIDRNDDLPVVRKVGVRTSPPATAPSAPSVEPVLIPQAHAEEAEFRAATHRLPLRRLVATARRRTYRSTR